MCIKQYGLFYWFSLPMSVIAQVILPETGSVKVRRRGVVRLGGKVGWAPVRLWWPYTSVEVALKCRKWRKALSSSLSLSFSLFLCSLFTGLVPCESSDARFLRSRGAVRVRALKCTVRPTAWDESRGLRPFSSRTLKLAPNLTPATRFHKLKQARGHRL